jgi:7-carboxy-7-deazaguanine synthase (Cx14CxxC type)
MVNYSVFTAGEKGKMGYQIKEVFYSLQGEGFHSGRPAIFCRFSQCNLWTGRERDRERAVCQFCDTDFIGTDGQNGGRFANAEALAQHLLKFWPKTPETPKNPVLPFVVLTGGEPLMQVDQTLIDTLHAHQFEIAIETNGTLEAPENIDWICVSPKAGAPLKLTQGHELKLVYPQADLPPESVAHLDFEFFYLQPMDVGNPQLKAQHQQAAVDYCLKHPQWRLSLQTHKLLNID